MLCSCRGIAVAQDDVAIYLGLRFQSVSVREGATMSNENEEHRQLCELIRRIAKDLFYELMDEHLKDYQHKRNLLRERWIDSER